jgi:hypothetical protein
VYLRSSRSGTSMGDAGGGAVDDESAGASEGADVRESAEKAHHRAAFNSWLQQQQVGTGLEDDEEPHSSKNKKLLTKARYDHVVSVLQGTVTAAPADKYAHFPCPCSCGRTLHTCEACTRSIACNHQLSLGQLR